MTFDAKNTNKLLNFVPAAKSVVLTGLPTLRQPISKALLPNTHQSHYPQLQILH